MNRIALLAKDSLRYWSRRPVLAICGFLLLALGTAAVNVLWVVTDTVVRKPLPFPEPDELFALKSHDVKIGKTLDTIAIADYKDFRDQAKSFEGIVGYRGEFLNYTSDDVKTTQVLASRVTSHFESVFQIKPYIGRIFEPEHFTLGNDNGVLVSHGFWKEHLNADPAVVGNSIQFDKKVFEILGILPESYKEPAFADVWMPFPEGTPEFFVRDSRYWSAVARLKDGITPAQAEIELQTIAKNLETNFPKTNKNRSVALQPLQEMMVGDFKSPLYLLFGAVILVMFATCFNLANLQMMSGLQRRQEMSARLALGEANSMLFLRSMAESFALCAVGGVLGWVLSEIALRNIHNILPPYFLPRIHELTSSGASTLVIIAVVLLAGMIFGIIPAWHAARSEIFQVVKNSQGRHSLSSGEKRIRNILLGAQIGVAVLVVHVAVVVVSSYREIKGLDLGFREERLLAIAVSPNDDRVANFMGLGAFYQRVEEWLETQPDVIEATSSSSPPLWGFDFEMVFELQGRDLSIERDTSATALYNSVSIDYLDAMDIKLVKGRGFENIDTQKSARVAIVNQAFVDEYLGDEEPLGKGVQIMPWMEGRFREIVGVTEDFRQSSLTGEVKPQIMVPSIQTPWLFTSFVVRVRGSEEQQAAKLRQSISHKYPNLGVTVVPFSELLTLQLAQREITYTLFTGFSIVVVALSLFGMGTQVAFDSADRRTEWGIRLSLGSSVRELRKDIAISTVIPVSLGALIGLAGFFGVRNYVPLINDAFSGSQFISAAVVLVVAVGISLAVAWWSSVKITRIQLSQVLRSV